MRNSQIILALMLLASTTVHAAESPMFDKMKTYCFGRYLVDVPYEAELKGQGNKYIDDSIQVTKMSEAALKEQIAKKLINLNKKAYPYYSFNREIKGSNGVILLGYKEAFKDPMYSIDSFKWERGIAFITSGTAYDDKTINLTVDRFNDYLKNLRYRSEREIPMEPGFCIENGFIANDGKVPQYEQASLAFQVKNNPDVWVRVESMVLSKSQPSLLMRIKESKMDLKYPGKIKRVREGALEVNGMKGEESLAYFSSDDNTGEAQQFRWEAQGEINIPTKPFIYLEINSGEGVAGVTGSSSLSTKQIQNLYNAIVKTIRLRPVK
ncbi:T6SS immunity protein Tli4 family protein [Chromobacterium phragmitis]|uniref:Tle cognate immunity protein 4 C-terminal domain-containing protein n=1 Tax=Chromobacterium phragmitis TaxID=2202141 RepID=A0A344UEM9_9NEIS|nr:T6SS immunity protein Tli4 family protein [Chromobacterium phragmitis]AXE33727.1 hypothetical protein DK843_04975 [Chromobacterium phragmitis]